MVRMYQLVAISIFDFFWLDLAEFYITLDSIPVNSAMPKTHSVLRKLLPLRSILSGLKAISVPSGKVMLPANE